MLEDSARGTLCAIHKTIHSSDNFPRSRHHMLKLCPLLKTHVARPTRIPVRSRRNKSRNNSPCNACPRMYRAQSLHEPWCGNLCPKPHIYCKLERKAPISTVNVEKTISCPEKMCCRIPSNPCTIASRSSIQLEQFAKNLINTDEVVNELKGEIRRVKHQLHHLSHNNNLSPSKTRIPLKVPPSTPEDRDQMVVKIKKENKRLKREVEAKKRLLDRARQDVTRAKDILADYEKKVSLLHVQAIKSSNAMKLSKEKFCCCLKEKDEKIRSLKESNDMLEKTIKDKNKLLEDKNGESRLLKDNIENLKKAFEETTEKCATLTETNQTSYETMEVLKGRLKDSTTKIDRQKDTVQTLQNKINHLNSVCKKIMSKSKKQQANYELIIKIKEDEMKALSKKLEETEKQSEATGEFQRKCEELEAKLREYEKFPDKCKVLEDECKKQEELIASSEKSFEQEKQEMEKLIEELTTVVKDNKATLTQMSEINKQQETVIKNQSVALLTKEEQLKLMEKESEDFKIKNTCLERQVEELKQSVSEPCSKEACLCISQELEKIKTALHYEKDNQLVKEKIIIDQSQTILNLQSQVKEKMSELNKAQNDTKYLEEEISKINEKLIHKHQELDVEIDEKESLIEKLRILECQKNQLAEEITDFEEMLHRFKETCGDNENQHQILRNLEEQIAEQKKEWEMQREAMVNEKQKAVCAAKFATQKLLDTVLDFQRQVEAQKKVQLLLTKMLHEKDDQLRIVKSKILNINKMTKDDVTEGKQTSMKELFFHTGLKSELSSNPLTNTSRYSSCSSCCRRNYCCSKQPPMCFPENNCDLTNLKCSVADIKLFDSNQKIRREKPSRDFT